MKIETDRIKSVSTWDSGGGIELDLIDARRRARALHFRRGRRPVQGYRRP